MNSLTILFCSLAILAHLGFFILESVRWGQPAVNRMFQVSSDQAEANRLFAFNQGFYNLFLAVGLAIGLFLKSVGAHPAAGQTLIVFTCCSMLAAAIVLVISAPRAIWGALLQGLPPLTALITIGVL